MPGFDNSQRPPQGPRRTKSLPSKYMIPSEDIGQYESGDPNRRRSAPPQAKVCAMLLIICVDANFVITI